MNKNDLKKAFNDIEPDIFMGSRLKAKMKTQAKTKKQTAFKIATSLSLCCAIAAGLLCGLPYLNNKDTVSQVDNSTTSNASSDILDSDTFSENSFTVLAYAAESPNFESEEMPDIENIEKTVINESEVVFPDIKIERGNYYEQTIAGETYKSYTAQTSSSANFDINGENIESVKYTLENEEFSIWDYGKYNRMIDNGEYYVAKINFQTTSDNILEEFKERWNNGDFEEYKESRFKDKSINLDDYSVSWSGSPITTSYGELDENNITYITINKGTILIEYENVAEQCFYHANSVTVPYSENYDRYSFIHFSWHPESALREIMEYKPINYEDLPGDTITIEVTFTDGEVQTKQIDLSFNSNGEVVAKLIEE